MTDPYRLDRFVAAQSRRYQSVLSELRMGRRTSHWMWFVFPQVKGLGSSAMAREYAIGSLGEALAYLEHPLLGTRLVECAEVLLAVDGPTALDIFGSPDDMKLRSSMTLFSRVSPPESVFHRVLDRYYDGSPDPATLRILGVGPS